MNKVGLTLCLSLFACVLLAQVRPKEHIAFINGTAHLGNGQVIEHCLFVIKGKQIESAIDQTGIKLNPAAFDTVIDLGGLHIYPALINANSVLGLHDAEAVRATVDFNEVGNLNPHVRALIAYNTDNQIVPTIRCNGVLYTQVTPRSGLISGSSSMMALDGWNWEDAVLKADDGVHVNFPRQPYQHQGEKDEQFKKRQERYKQSMAELLHFFSDAKAYLEEEKPLELNLRFEAMRKVLKGNARLYLHADKALDILSVIRFVEEKQIPQPVLVGGKEAYKVLKPLKASGIPLMLGRLHDLPEQSEDDIDILFRMPAMLKKDSILFCLQLEGDMEAAMSRNLPYQAGQAVAYGLDKESALRAVSLDVARITGTEQQLGSLEEGKLASFVLCEGDLLDMKESRIKGVYLNGKALDLNNKQTQLYQKYRNKYKLD